MSGIIPTGWPNSSPNGCSTLCLILTVLGNADGQILIQTNKSIFKPTKGCSRDEQQGLSGEA